MLRRQRQIRIRIHKLVDAGLFCLGFWLAHLLRFIWPLEIFGGTPIIQPFSYYAWVLLVIFPLTPLMLSWQGFYNRPILGSRRKAAWQLLMACFALAVVVVLVLFLRRAPLARAVIILFPVLSYLLVFAKEQMVRMWISRKIGQSHASRRLVLVGTPLDNERFRQELSARSTGGFTVSGEVDLNLHPIEHLVEMLHEHSANAVVLNAKNTLFGQIEKTIEVCELEGIEVWLLADFFKTQVFRTSLDDFYNRPILVFRSTPEESWQAFAKQMIDSGGAFLLLLLLALPLSMVALLIRYTSPGPVLFRQQRSGLNGRPFIMLKFRSMVNDAEQRKHELATLNEMNGPVFKVTNDPRVTPMGRWLRRYSIDELPQLINVLKGEMSLVGPRPLPVDEVRRFDDLSHRRRLSVKPGITCLWQVSGRNNVKDFRDWVRLDLEYIDNWSLWLDLKILLRTIPAVFIGTGAK
jgi:exopolysaccharide biosynthesis polyprenyl glycosylphosphotransferase